MTAGSDPAPDANDAARPLGMAALVECPHCGTRVLPLPGHSCPACRRDLHAAPDRSVVVESAEVLIAGRKLARRLFRDHRSAAEVMQNLIDRGIRPDAVARVVQEACAEQVEWYDLRGWKSLVFGTRCSVVSGLAVLLAFGVWQDQRSILILPSLLAAMLSVGMVVHGLRLRRRAAEFSERPIPFWMSPLVARISRQIRSRDEAGPERTGPEF